MSRIAALGGAVLIALVAAPGKMNADTLAAPAPWIESVEDERLLSKFQANAKAIGALGFYRDEDSGAMVVLVPPAVIGSFDLNSLGPSAVPVTFKVSSVDPAELEALKGRLTALTASRAKGESISFYFDPRTERMRVATTITDAAVRAAIGNSSALANVERGAVALESRYNDYSPFWGGSALKFWNGSTPETTKEMDCTSGFAMVSGSTKVLVTAAHCLYIDRIAKSPAVPRTIGTGWLGHRHCPIDTEIGTFDDVDLQLIKIASGSTVDDTIYVGDRTGIAADVADSGGDPAVGAYYAVSGAKTYEHTSLEVLSLEATVGNDACNPYGPGYMTDVIIYAYVQGMQSSCPTTYGDSGAPFYFRFTTNPPLVYIRGMHFGKSLLQPSGTTCFAMRYNKIEDASGFALMH